eukprot:CAMPEP_0202703922 /NCGR_PEP_ID=MMETSP1385-20130828/16709_1 /ASSEMBLY_ACC=CAM_ASM_000861 /TAXON_ID=933848 /ORGANISM="Elphidium margaritaceum" /LENGTH=654 /DNA_ID=CAMNT_0049361851 /DNA_START=29 /DNA_END=1993 /DNA_ORIENTATION=-
MTTTRFSLCDCCDVTVTDWVRVERHSPSYITQLRSNNIAMLSDCGRLAFSELTSIFNSITHRTLRDKIRLERDLTALHMRYRLLFKRMQRHRQRSQVKMVTSKKITSNATGNSNGKSQAMNDEITMIVESIMNKHANANATEKLKPPSKIARAATAATFDDDHKTEASGDDKDDEDCEDADDDKDTTDVGNVDRTKSSSAVTSSSVADGGSSINTSTNACASNESDASSPSPTMLSSSSPPSSTAHADGKPDAASHAGDDDPNEDEDEDDDDVEFKPMTLFLDAKQSEKSTGRYTQRTQTQTQQTQQQQPVAVANMAAKKKSMMRLVTERGLYKEKTIKRKTRKNNNCKTHNCNEKQQQPQQQQQVGATPPAGNCGGGAQSTTTCVSTATQFDGVRFLYLWMYKAIVMHFFALNNVPMPEKKIFDSLYFANGGGGGDELRKEDLQKFKMEVTIAPRFAIRCYGFGGTPLAAEYDCYKHIFQALTGSTASCMDHLQLLRLVRDYQERNYPFDHRHWNKWWFDPEGCPRHDIFQYFPDIRKKKCRDPQEKAMFLAEVNRTFHHAYHTPGFSFLSEADIQMLFYHSVSFLFPFKQPLPRDMNGLPLYGPEYAQCIHVTRARQDLLMFVMQTYHFRKEFCENLMKMPIAELLDFMRSL